MTQRRIFARGGSSESEGMLEGYSQRREDYQEQHLSYDRYGVEGYNRTDRLLDNRSRMSGERVGAHTSCRSRRSLRKLNRLAILLPFLLSAAPMSAAQSCISLSGSSQCPAFNASSISTGPALTGFLYVQTAPVARASSANLSKSLSCLRFEYGTVRSAIESICDV